MRLQYVVYAVLVFSHHTFVQGKEKKVYGINDKVIICSSFLSVIINEFCNNTYKIVKRDTSVLLAKLNSRSKADYKTNKRWLAEERWRRVRRQIANECCENSCTIREMIMYCPDDAKLLQEQPDIFY